MRGPLSTSIVDDVSPTLATVGRFNRRHESVIAFDMDGVLIDSAASIADSLIRALMEQEISLDPEFSLGPHVGKPLEQLVVLAAATQLSSQEVVACMLSYRRINDAVTAADLPKYPGVVEMLIQSAELCDLCVLTTKNEKSAKRQLSLLNLDQYFVDVFGTMDDSRHTSKDARWREAERQLGSEETSKISLIVGDRASDVVAAKKIGRLAIGATWGYGTSGELLEAAADRIADSPLEVPSLIQEMLD